MSRRPSIPRKLRFEVFKRDSFTCQYCGAAAPAVVLHADHVNPVVLGGATDLLNLVTSCADCNGGKGAVELSDDSAIQKQRRQLEDLNERRLQIEMMLEWREELASVQEVAIDGVVRALSGKARSIGLTEAGRREVGAWIRRYPVDEVLSAVDAAFDQYLVFDEWGVVDIESWRDAFRKVPRILLIRAQSGKKPYLRDMFYVRGILRNRLCRLDERGCLFVLEDAILDGATVEDLKEAARRARSWTDFLALVRDCLPE